ncbi:MAG: glycosyltransferase family 61 protein [Bacteroidota bacterium]
MKKRIKTILRPMVRPFQKALTLGLRSLRRRWVAMLRIFGLGDPFLPTGSYKHPEEWAKKENGQLRGIIPGKYIERRPPGTLDEKVHWVFQEAYVHKGDDACLLDIPNGRVWVKVNQIQRQPCIAILSEEGKVIGDVSYGFGAFREVGNNAIFEQINIGQPHHIKGTALVLTTVVGSQFYHFFSDLLPKLHMMEQAGIGWDDIDALVINSNEEGYIREVLEWLEVPMEKIISNRAHPHIQADRLLYLSAPCRVSNPPKWLVDWLQASFSRAVSPRPDLPKRIYISRAGAKFRQLTNRPAVEALVEASGFAVIRLEDLPLADQIALFAQAEAVVAPHGAGLTHLSWCRPGTKVIEFFSPYFQNLCYYALADMAGLDYYYLMGEGAQLPEGRDAQINIQDITLSISKLEALLDKAGLRNIAETDVI